jgi:hypothetical protein
MPTDFLVKFFGIAGANGAEAVQVGGRAAGLLRDQAKGMIYEF